MGTGPAVEVTVLVAPEDRRRVMKDDVRTGLATPARSIPPVWFYDEEGSLLFDRITRLPEYYLTRAERSILDTAATPIAAASGATTLVEIGSGTSEKTRLLLDAMAASGRLQRIILLDISEDVLVGAASELSSCYGVDVEAVVGDLRRDLLHLARPERQLWAFLGSTIGNFEPGARRKLLAHFAEAMSTGDHLLLGTDLRKEVGRLEAAYDDAEGVTARFNLNVLRVLNREVGADFDLSGFEHRAVWNAEESWMEMRLRSRRNQTVGFADLDLAVELAAGEEILTEISTKFDPVRVPDELAEAGLTPVGSWTDRDGDFALSLARR